MGRNLIRRSDIMSRVERLIANSDDDVDVIAIMNGGEPFLDSTFWYITEQCSGCFEGAMAFVSRDGRLDVVVSQLEAEIAKGGKGDVHVYATAEERNDYVKDILKDCKKLGINSDAALYSMVNYFKRMNDGVEIVDSLPAINATVNVKERSEIDTISKACDISSKVASKLPEMISEGASEAEVASEMDVMMRRLGGTGNAFDTIAAFGPYSAEPHHTPCDYRLKRGDAALFDFGSRFGRYCSDLTRTIFLGEPVEKLKRAYDVVLNAQEAGIERIRPGAKASDVDAAARELIDSTEFKGLFIHSFGHGIGMDVHQNIHVSPRSEHVLEEGNVISAEPGIYIPGVGGIRIEDTILVTKDGCRRLTSYDHSFTVV